MTMFCLSRVVSLSKMLLFAMLTTRTAPTWSIVCPPCKHQGGVPQRAVYQDPQHVMQLMKACNA